MRHLGNAVGHEREHPEVLDTRGSLNLISLGPVAGVSAFTKTFPERGPRDRKGRSLRDFDLQTHLFEYPLSYMIYSKAFDALPERVRGRIYERLYEILASRHPSGKYKKLTQEDRRALLEIVADTKAPLPAFWKARVTD